jgi:hypothetical protein
VELCGGKEVKIEISFLENTKGERIFGNWSMKSCGSNEWR